MYAWSYSERTLDGDMFFPAPLEHFEKESKSYDIYLPDREGTVFLSGEDFALILMQKLGI